MSQTNWNDFAPVDDKGAQQPKATPDSVNWSDFAPADETPSRGFGGWARDIGATAVKGAIGVPEALVGLADIPTGGRVGKLLENEDGAVGFRPKQAKEIVNNWHSDATKQAQQKFQQADGIVDKAVTAIQNPSLIATAVGESLPSMGAGGVAARGLMAATRLGQMGAKGAALAGAAGEGIAGAGAAAEQIRQETDDGLLTPGQAAAAAGTGLATAGFGALGGKIANRLGIGDAETMLAQGNQGIAKQFADDASRAATNPLVQQQAVKSIPRQVIEGAVAEGFLEELPQSVAEQVFQNLALDKPWYEDVDAAVVMGTLSGAAMGGAAAGYRGFREPSAPEQQPVQPGQPPQPAPQQPAPNPGLDMVRQSYEAQLQALREQEQGEPIVEQTAPPDGAAALAQQRAQAEAERQAAIEASRAVVSPDDEIYQSTGMDQMTPSQRMGLRSGPESGALESAAALAVDAGATAQLQQAAAQAQAQAQATEAAKKVKPAKKKTTQAADVDPQTGEIASGMAAWSDADLSTAFRGAQSRDVRLQLAKELQRRRAARAETTSASGTEDAGTTPAITAATTGAMTDGPQAAQAQQAIAQPAQAGNPTTAAGAADTAAAAPAPAGGSSLQAAGLTDGRATTEDAGAQAAAAPGAQAAPPAEERAQRLSRAGEAWTRMPTAERQALAQRIDANPIVKKNLHGAQWEHLNGDIQRKLADLVEPQAAAPVPTAPTAPQATGKPRMGESADAVWQAVKAASGGHVVEGRGIRYPVMEVIGGDWFMLNANGKLQLIDRGASQLAASDPTDAQIRDFHDALDKDQVQVKVMSRPGYESDYKTAQVLQVLHSPSGQGFKTGAAAPAPTAPAPERNPAAQLKHGASSANTPTVAPAPKAPTAFDSATHPPQWWGVALPVEREKLLLEAGWKAGSPNMKAMHGAAWADLNVSQRGRLTKALQARWDKAQAPTAAPEPDQKQTETVDQQAKAAIKPEADKDGNTVLGRRKDGVMIRQDKNGVRWYAKDGVRISETVSMRPTRQGMQIERGELKPEFMTAAESEAAAPAPKEAAWTEAEESRLLAIIGRHGGVVTKDMGGHFYAEVAVTNTDTKGVRANGKTSLSAKRALLEKLESGQYDELDAEMRGYEAKAEQKPSASPAPAAVTGKQGAVTGVRNVIEALRQRAMQAAAERENRKAAREVERALFAELIAPGAGMLAQSQEQIAQAVRDRLAARDGATALNPIQVGRLARAIHKHLQANAEKIKVQAGRDPLAKQEAIMEGVGAAYGENGPEPLQQANFLLGFEHALSGKTKSTLSGDGLADMLKGYEQARAWIGTEAGAQWYTGKGRKKLENTGTDLRRHWEAMKAQMKADESDIEKAWKQIERATNRANLFAAFLPEGAAPGWVKYVTDMRGAVTPFKQWLDATWDNWYGSSAWGRGEASANLKHVLSGARYPRNAAQESGKLDQWRSDPAFRIETLQGAASEYLEHVRALTAPLDGAKSVSEAADRLVEAFFDEKYRAEARKPDTYMYGGYQVNAKLGGVIENKDLLKLRLGSDYTQYIVKREATLELPSKATPLTPPKLDRVTREGGKDWRKGKDVTPQEFKAAFGFADVGFGEWVGARNDQDHLNYAYDAYMDMAAHLGIEPAMVGFGGSLHFTIGALGHGKHAAHFSPNHPGPNGHVSVINLTNTRGDGTVYHEYGHALDHKLGGDWKAVRAQIIELLSHQLWDREAWEHKAAAFLDGHSYWRGDKRGDRVDAAVHAMNYYRVAGRRPQTAYKVNADQLGKDYWGNEFELFARAIEAWAVDTMAHGNTYLVQPAWAGDAAVTPAKGYRGTPYPSGDERKLFNQVLGAFAKAIKSEGGQLVVDAAAFERNLPEAVAASRSAQRQLASREGMLQFQRELQERRAAEASAKEAQAKAEARAEQAKQDQLAAEALATLAPATVDPAPAGQTPGHLSDDDLSAIFDEAAAELREQHQEQPEMPAPGLDADSLPTPPRAASPEAPKADAAPAATDKKASQLLAEAAKLGVKGADEALKGLAKLFGGTPGRLNSFPAGFDQDTYNQAKPHFKAALSAFQAAGKTLKDLFKLLIQQFGDGVKPYAVQFAKDEGLGAQLGQAPAAGEAQSPSGKVADFVQARLAKGEGFTWQALFGEADRAFGGTQAEGKYTPKDAYDAMEAGMNRHILANPAAFHPGAAQADAAAVTQRLHDLTQLLPTQSKRTAEQDEFQQFSTVPALAYVANWVADVNGADTMLEPSAGIGGLAAFAKNAGARLVLNELSARRAAVLREVFPGAKVYQENAEQINNILPDSEAPSVVVMNPPFSATAGRIQGRRDTKVGALHVEQALKRMVDGGRLVAIVGEGMNLDRPAFRDWWQKVQQEYDVRAVIPMDGSGYAKYGTTFDNAILVIDKVKPSGRAVVATPAKTYPELINLLAEIKNDRPDANAPASTADQIERFGAEQALGDVAAAGQDRPGAGHVGADAGAAVGDGAPGGQPAVGAGGATGGAVGGPKRPRGDGAQPGRGGRDAGADAARGGNPAAATGGGLAADVVPGLTIQAEAADAPAPAELSNAVFESYRPQRLSVPGAQPHPGPLVQSAAMAAVLPPAATYTPNLPRDTVTQGLLSVAQIEAVVYAGQAHSEFLPDVPTDNGPVSYRRGFFIGDGTGVGKGREISGILLDNWRQGRTKAVWISEKQGLMNDAKRDFKGVGGDDSVIFNQNKTKAEDAIDSASGIIFTTYSTLRSGAQSVNAGKPLTKGQFEKAFPKGSKVTFTNGRGTFELDRYEAKAGKVWVNNNGRVQFAPDTMVQDIDGITEWKQGRPDPKGKKAGLSRLDQLVNWLGKDYDGVIAFDEAHNAGNAVSIKGERGASEPSAQALAVVELQRRLPKARVVYVSATGATQVSNLSYATRLGLWGPGTPFPSVENFIAEMVAGGLSAMELVARDIKQMGAYLARSLSYEGVSYSRLEHELTPIQRDIYNRLAEAWQVTLRNMDKALEVTGAVGSNGKGNSKTKMAAKAAYWGAQQRFFNQIITSMQMPTVLAQIEADVAAGEAVVLQLVNTNEAQQTRALAKRKEEDESADLEELDLTPRDMLIQMVEKSFPVVQHQEQTDENDKIVRVPVMDAEGNPVLNREAVKMRDALLNDLKNISVPDGPLEMLLNQFGPDRVAEVTGRTQRVVRKDDGTGNVRAQLETRGSSAARADADAFMADRKPILIFSDAGGTGFSFHADNTKANKRKRKHYLVQPGWRADKAVQGFGRTHRTNQASAPHYYLASTDIPAQKRFLSAIARRLDQLGALTKGQRDTANQGMFSERDNLESKYATEAVRQFFEDGVRQTLQGIDFREFLRQTGLEDIIDDDTNQIAESKMPETRLFLNRMLSLTLDMQNQVFDAFLARMDEKVAVAQQRGEFDAGMQTLLALETRVVNEAVAYTDPHTGAQTHLVELELKHATTLYPFPDAQLKGAEQVYLVNQKSGRVYARTHTGVTTLQNGAVVQRYRLAGTNGVVYKDQTEFAAHAGVEPYKEVPQAEARALWKAENEKKPATYSQTMHMIVGAMLPIWDRLKMDGRIKVARTQTVDGRRILGMTVPSKNLAELRKRLDVESAAAKMSPAEVMARLLQGSVAELVNGWKLERARVSNDLRIEIEAGYVSAPVGRELVGMGVLQERINWKERYFVPTGAAGVPVLEALLKSRPLMDLAKPGEDAQDEAHFGTRERTRPGTPTDRAVMDMVREGRDAQDILRMIAGTSQSRFNKQIARLLIKTEASPEVSIGGDMGGGQGFKFLAKYSRRDNALTMSEGAQAQAEQIFLHEMIHAATLMSLDRKGLQSMQMRRLYEHVKQQGGAAGQYGMKNVGEFVAEAFTNPEFQRALKGMRAPSASRLQSAWDALVRILRSIVGLPDTSQDALSAALEIGARVMRENMRLRTSANIRAQAQAQEVDGDAYFGASDLRGLKTGALDQISQSLSHPGKVSVWDKTVGTMRNLAERAPAFKPVFESAQRFIDDVATLANEAADAAPRLLPRVDSWRDLNKKPISAADNKAIAKPLFEGTLLWARDVDGTPVTTEALNDKYRNEKADRKAQLMLATGKIQEGVLKMWRGLPLEQYETLINSRFESTILKPGVVWSAKELQSMFGLNDQQVGLYQEARAAVDRSIDITARADMLRVLGEAYAGMRDAVMEAGTLDDAMALLTETLQQEARDNPDSAARVLALNNEVVKRHEKAKELMAYGYAPLSRFGRYTVDVVDQAGERQYFGMFESMREANLMKMKMASVYPGATVTQGTMSQEAFKLFAGITPESLEQFGEMLGLRGDGNEAKDKAFQAYLQLAKNNHSALKRLIHRKGIDGYSEDVGRVLASFVYSNARLGAGALNAGTMENAIEVIPKEQGELRDVAMALRSYIQDPQEEGQAVRGMLFAQYLGGSVASAFVNMTQPFAVTMPWLSQFGGMKKAGAQLARALKDMARAGTDKGFRYEADLANALKHAEDDGVVSPQEIHQLMAQARGTGSLRVGDGTKMGDARAAASNAWERTKVAWGQPFALAEQFNRRSTFIAAFRMAKEQGRKNPAEFARKAVLETQFLYSKANKGRFMRGAIGGTLMTFKTYSVSYLELLHRMWTQGGPEGKRAVGWAMAMLLLMGGAGGLPFMEDAEDLIDGIAQLMGYNVSAKQWRKQALRDIVGKELADFVEQGVSGLPGAPVDVSGRLGMGNLIPGTGLLLSKQNRERDLLEIAGPAGDLVARGFGGVRKALTGDVSGAALEVSPMAVRNAAKGIDMAASGIYKDTKGYKVIDTTLDEALAKAIGFQPKSVAEVQDANSFMQRSKSFYIQTSSEIKAQWAKALFEKDEAALERVRERLASWNRNNPDQPIVVKMPDVWKRVREMGKDRTARIADTAPKALRQQMRDMAREAG